MKTSRSLILSLAVMGLLCTAPLARAQDSTDLANFRGRVKQIEKQLAEVRSIVLQARATGHPVEVKDAGPDPQVVDLQSKFDDLSQTLRSLTGQVETMGHDLDQARKDAAQALAQNAALSDRLDHLEKQAAALAPPPPAAAAPDAPAAGPAAAPGEDAKSAYAHARQLLLDGDYPSASIAFQDFIDHYGDSANAPAARYWLGETKYIQSDYAGAATALFASIRGWPRTAWAPDAVVKLSMALIQENKPQDACRALAEFDRHYPKAPAATRTRADAARVKAGCAG